MNKKSYNVTGTERKEMAQVVGQAIGIEPVYMRMPTCAYAVNNIIINRAGDLLWDERTDDETIREVTAALERAGYTAEEDAPAATEEPTEGAEENPQEAEEAEEPERMTLTISVPMGRHTGNTLRNLVNLIYTRASLINKALGTAFSAERGLVDALSDNETLYTVENFRKALAAYEEEHGPALTGIAINEDEIRFFSLPETTDADLMNAFTELTATMNAQAITQKRIQAKEVAEENEKYALRIWLTRLGMNGPDYKTTRKALMKNLSGDCAFRTEAEKERWKANRAAERAAEEVTEA